MLGQVLPSSHSRHQVATPETELGLRVAPQQPLHQIGTVQVAGSFAGNQVIFHLANPPIFEQVGPQPAGTLERLLLFPLLDTGIVSRQQHLRNRPAVELRRTGIDGRSQQAVLE